MEKEKAEIIGAGSGVGITGLMLAIAYLPGFFPAGYIRLRANNLINLVPIVAVTQLTASIAWLFIKTRKGNNNV